MIFVDPPAVLQAAATLAAARYAAAVERQSSPAMRLVAMDNPVEMLVSTLKEMAAQGVIPESMATFQPTKPK